VAAIMDVRAILPVAVCAWRDGHAGSDLGQDIGGLFPHANYGAEELEDLLVVFNR